MRMLSFYCLSLHFYHNRYNLKALRCRPQGLGERDVPYFAEIFGIGTPELLIIAAIVLLLFGGKKLPELFRSAGTSVRELRKGLSGEDEKQKDASKPNPVAGNTSD